MKKLLVLFAISASLASLTASCKQAEYRPDDPVVVDSLKTQTLNDTISIDSVSLKAYHAGDILPDIKSNITETVIEVVKAAETKTVYAKSKTLPVVVYCIDKPDKDHVAALVSTSESNYLIYGSNNKYRIAETPELIFGCPTISWQS